MAATRTAYCVVVISDGFGDADLNNDGIALGLPDVDVNNSGTVGTYTPARSSNASMGTNPEVSSVLDASDTGLRWLSQSGFTTSNTGDPKAYLAIVDDSQGSMQETKPTAGGGLGITAINSGYAMAWNSKGKGSVAAGFFDKTIALGPQVGDQVKVSFDFRVWRDAPNANPVEQPADGQLRFGLYQDTDHQLGMTNPVAGRDFDDTVPPDGTLEKHSAVWGHENGWFEGSRASLPNPGSNIGSPGDHGWFGQLILSDGDPILGHGVPNGGDWRIREELNEAQGGASDLRILNGATDSVAQPHESSPGAGDFGLTNLDPTKVYSISLTLERFTDVTTADTISATMTVKDRATGQEYSLSNFEPVMNMGVPDGISSDSWDYFAISNTSSVDDFDFLMDNFTIERLGSNAGLAGDYNGDGTVDAADYVVWRKGGSPNPNSVTDYNTWRANFGASTGGALSGGATVPEPATAVLFTIAGLLAVGAGKRRR
jgi:hypothetical protein